MKQRHEAKSMSLEEVRTQARFKGLEAFRSKDEAEDISSIVTIKYLKDPVATKRPKAYWSTVIFNTVIERFRAKSKAMMVDLSSGAWDWLEETIHEKAFGHVTDEAGLGRYFDAIGPEYEETVRAYAKWGNAKEAASSIGLTVPAFKSRLYRAQRIANRLRDATPEEARIDLTLSSV